MGWLILPLLLPFRAEALTPPVTDSEHWPCGDCHPVEELRPAPVRLPTELAPAAPAAAAAPAPAAGAPAAGAAGAAAAAAPDAAEEPAEREHSQKLGSGHERLGKGRQACWSCHLSNEHPERLLVLGGLSVSMEEGSSATCERCHMSIYREWSRGFHGKGRACSDCHVSHDPAHLDISLAPFGAEHVELLIGRWRQPIEALPPPAPPTHAAEAPLLPLRVGLAAAALLMLAGAGLAALRRPSQELSS